MKVLKIESNGIPKFTSDGKEWKNIEDIQKEDIASMLDFCIDHDVVLEGYDDELIKIGSSFIIELQRELLF